MIQKIKSEYQLTVSDLLEAQQLYKYKFPSFIFDMGIIILILLYLLQDIYRLQDPDFMIISYFKQQSIEQSSYDSWTSIIIFFTTFLLCLGAIFPKLNPLYRRSIAKDYQHNFVKQELKQISISPTGLTITSENFRESRQWHGFNKMAENKKIFLLCHDRSQEGTIIPKRIFLSQADLNYFRQLVTTKKKQLISE
ncbi:MAG: YcxB family protein [Cyanobacteria bacterium P01_G01_bin.67]